MDPKIFQQFRKIIKKHSGIELTENKEALLTARVGKRMRKLDISEYKAYLKFLLDDKSGKEMVALLDVISTNVTSFYREAVHFEFLKPILQEWENQGKTRYRVWCAAASSGEEPFTIAITMQESLNKMVDGKILATDISTIVLDKCRVAVYDEKKTEPIPNGLRNRYFDKIKTDEGTVYEAKKVLKDMMLFKRLNLTVQPYPMKGPLDIIFCRNVMIYFNGDTRQKIINEMYKLLKPGGYLFVGHSESLTGLDTGFQIVKPSIYSKPE